jgi:hypothetical protein
VNQFSVVKHRSPCHVAHSKTTQSPLDSMENDSDSSDADSRDDGQVDDRSESSTDDSNYNEGKSGTSNSKEESGEEEDEVEDAEDNPKGILSTPVSKKGKVSDYDTPIVDLLLTNRSRRPECNIRKSGRKSSHKKRRGRENRNRTSSTSSNDNSQGEFLYCYFYHHVSFLIFSCQTFCNDCFHFSVFFTFYLTIKEYYFSNYYQYLLDYPSGSEEDDSNFVVEEPHETQENDSHVIDSDMVLSSSDSEESSLNGNVQEDCSRYCYRLQWFHKDAFYSAYLPEWEKAKKSSHLISQEKYDEIVALLRTKHQKKEPARLLKY